MRIARWFIVVVGITAVGCGRIAHQTAASPPPSELPRSSAAETAIADLFKAHGEKGVVTGPDGVGIEGNATRIRAAIYGSKPQGSGFVVETEFRIHLPSGDEIVEYVAGVGDTEKKAIDDTLVNFALTTFHPIYKCFVNPADKHQPLHAIILRDGQKREVAMGDILLRGGASKPPMDLNSLRPGIQTEIAKLPLAGGPHWVKIVYGQSKSTPMTVSVTLDNSEHEGLTKAIKALDWPRRDEVYIAKEFIVIK